MMRFGMAIAGAALAAGLGAAAFAQSAAPAGWVVEQRGPTQPRQILRSEVAGGRQSYLVALGATLFSAPAIMGAPAQAVNLSCQSCHTNGDVNRDFFIPAMSSRPGNIDVSGPHFNPRADNGVFDPVDIPSLRGIRFTAPYGRDGRIASLREFTRAVIVGEFAGAEPSPLMLDALVAYMNELEFIPNPRLAANGRLARGAAPAARRGEALFNRPFAGMAGQACASCHVPSAAFVDGRRHDVGSGGFFRTPTLLNANFTAPYFHDGRFATYADVVNHFDQTFDLRLGARERADLVAYLEAIGDGEEAAEAATFRRQMAEIGVWVDVLETAIVERDTAVIALVVDSAVRDIARIRRMYPTGEPESHQTQRPDRRRTPVDYPALQEGLRAVQRAAGGSDFAGAATALAQYLDLVETMVANYPRRRR